MDPITDLRLSKLIDPRWEDEEKSNYGVDHLREEFQERLYAEPQEPFLYDIRTQEIVEELLQQGFTVASYVPGVWTMEAPKHLSHTKARKVISTMIQLYTAAKDLGRAKDRYERLVQQLNRLAYDGNQ